MIAQAEMKKEEKALALMKKNLMQSSAYELKPRIDGEQRSKRFAGVQE